MADALCTIDYPDDLPETYGNKRLRVVRWRWTSATGGTVTSAVTRTGRKFSGWVTAFITVPGTGGDAPSAYNIALKDYNAYWNSTISTKALASATLTERQPAGEHIANSQLELAIDTAGDVNQGTAYALILTP